MDGFGSAWAHHFFNRGEKEIIYQAVSYPKPGDAVFTGYSKEDTLVILDFSYPLHVMQELAKRVKSILIIDHHASAIKDLQNLVEKNVTVVFSFDNRESGCGLTWRYYAKRYPFMQSKEVEMPLFLRLIEDRDLWEFSYGESSKNFHAAVSLMPKEFEVWDDFFVDLNTREIVESGKAMRKYEQNLVNNIALKAYKIEAFRVFNNNNLMFCNCPPELASEVGNTIASKNPEHIACCYYIIDGEVFYSFRSVGDLDSSVLAKRLGGGGHKNASGAKVSFDKSHLTVLPLHHSHFSFKQ